MASPLRLLRSVFSVLLRTRSVPAALTGGQWSGTSFVDSFKRNRTPTPNELLAELKSTAFTCASINASVCASYPPRLFVTTDPGQPEPRCLTGPVDRLTERHLRHHAPRVTRRATVHKAAHIREVFDHPLLTLLRQVNPAHNAFDLWTKRHKWVQPPHSPNGEVQAMGRRKVKRAWSYIRFSKPTQLKGDSLRRQLEWGKGICEHKGWFLDESLHLQDLGVSAFRGKNASSGSLGAFLEAIKQGKVLPGDVLLLESLDRLSRENIDDAYDLFRSILRTGVEVYTREPERHYRKTDLNNFASIIEAIVYMERAYNESATKSMRGVDYWKARRLRLKDHKPIHQHVPAWLKLSADRQRFEVKPQAVKAIKLIYKWAGEGMGLNPITAKLNKDKVPTIGKRKHWVRSYVAKLLSDRSVLGEYQPHVLKDEKRVPIGEPIPGYFPVVISEDEWYRVRHTVKERGRKGRGRTGRDGGSLFRGLMFDARDGCSMQLAFTGSPRANNSHVLVSSGSRNGLEGSQHMPFPYEPVERAFLNLVKELKPADVVGDKQADNREDEIASLAGKLEEINHKIATVQKRVLKEQRIEPLLTLLETLDKQKKETATRLDELKAKKSYHQPTVLGEVQTLAELVDKAQGEERAGLRNKIKARIRQLVSEIWFVAWDLPGNWRLAEMQVFFHSGHVRSLWFQWKRKGTGRGQVSAATSNLYFKGQMLAEPSPSGVIPTLDLRNYRNAEYGGWYDRVQNP